MECCNDCNIEWFGKWYARLDNAAIWYDRNAQYADQYLVRWCRRGLDELLYLYYHCRLHQWSDGGTYARIPLSNNGSGFEGLGDNTYFWNWTCGIVLILSRFIPIVGQVAIAGLLAQKRYIPEGAGTLKTDTVTFSIMTFAVIFIVAALSFFPAHALSTIAEHFSL